MDHRLKVAFGVACMFLCGHSFAQRAPAQPLPDDKGKAEFVHNCTACHRAEMVTAVKKTPEDWRKSVDEMASRGTDGTKEDLDNVVLYLDKYFALGNSAPSDTKQPAEPSPSLSSVPGSPAMLNASDIEQVKRVIAENGCLTCHRIEQQGGSTASSLNGIGARRSADQIRVVMANPHPAPRSGSPGPFYERKITGEDLDILVRYLVSLPPSS